MDARQLAHVQRVQSELPQHPGPPASAINPLKARLGQLRQEFTTAPQAERARIASAITHCEALIQQLERQNGPSRHP